MHVLKVKTSLKHTNFLIDLTPLVDVTFLMLIFFIVTSDILPLKSLQIENPPLKENTEALTTQILVVMDAQQVIYLGSKKDIIDLTNLQFHLQKEVQTIQKNRKDANPTVVLSVDRRVDYGTFLKLFSITKNCGQPIRLVYHSEEIERV